MEEQKTKKKTAYERSIERLEAKLGDVNDTLPADVIKNPEEILRQVVDLQKHLEERFATNQNEVQSAYFTAKRAIFLGASRYFSSVDATLYQNDVPQLIVNQRALTNLLVKAVKKTRKEMWNSYQVLEGYRQETGSTLGKKLENYSRLERKLEGIDAAEEDLEQDEATVNGTNNTYAQKVLNEGDLLLAGASVRSSIESLEDDIRYNHENVERLKYEQLVVLQCVQKHDRATASLKKLGEQQAIAYTVLSAFDEGRNSIETANQAMGVLSESIFTSQQLVTSAFERIRISGDQIEAKNQPRETATRSSKNMSENLRDSIQITDNHEYVERLRENSIKDFKRLRKEERKRYNQET
ncbi:hypothetical protein CMO88_04060 [Candidatus Woesearchaeota archaeon]|mgnify:CR=1 FL=1|nr:hypothetical protein [Candidatus Woesearchaeota archaeon]|tara:strand:- start:26545 stop:27606 length:1062 start_codon:yes stop_codon:yes gene_type:complete